MPAPIGSGAAQVTKIGSCIRSFQGTLHSPPLAPVFRALESHSATQATHSAQAALRALGSRQGRKGSSSRVSAEQSLCG